MKALLVIDMQQDYIGEMRNKKRYTYEVGTLIDHVNARITNFQQNGNLIIYILNKKITKAHGEVISEIDKRVKMASPIMFDKNKSSCFSNSEFAGFLRLKRVSEIECVGVDGNFCVAQTALSAIQAGYTVIFPCSCIGVMNQVRFTKTKQRLSQKGIKVIE
ncbi:cysteine hydrolase family protein [Bacillus sp. 1P06AnD]|uniref:cysteine hydrolase family protein n=1 Tax=Bacillus sp. 1P06AnD TaxID=3132208 RepID=UPI0039A3BF7A